MSEQNDGQLTLNTEATSASDAKAIRRWEKQLREINARIVKYGLERDAT